MPRSAAHPLWLNPISSKNSGPYNYADRMELNRTTQYDEEQTGRLLDPLSPDSDLGTTSDLTGTRDSKSSGQKQKDSLGTQSYELHQFKDDASLTSTPIEECAVEDEGLPGHPEPGWSERLAEHGGEGGSRRPRSHYRIRPIDCVSCPTVLASFSCALLVMVLISLLAILLGYFDPITPSLRPSNSPRPASLYRLLHPTRFSFPSSKYPTSFSRDIRPLPLHSHNDYWRAIPLYTALSCGCISVEADIWSFPSLSLSPSDLLVGHSPASLIPTRTLNSLYIDPLVEILESMNPDTPFTTSTGPTRNGVFDTDAEQTLVLLIDLKAPIANFSSILPHLLHALEPLRQRDWLTIYKDSQLIPGPVTVVLTGNAPPPPIPHPPGRPDKTTELFLDAPLGSLANSPTYNSSNAYFASTSLVDSVGPMHNGTLNDTQVDVVRAEVGKAHARGLKVRYWGVPEWGPGVFKEDRGVWAILGRELDVKPGGDVLSVDDLEGFKIWGGLHAWA